MKQLSEYYPELVDEYGHVDISFVISGYDMYEDYKEYEKNGYHYVCRGQYVFKDYVDRTPLEDDDVMFEDYETVKQFNVPVAIVTRKFVFEWCPQYEDDFTDTLDDFNSCYQTNFTTFEEMFNYALNDEGGLNLSMNIVHEGELV